MTSSPDHLSKVSKNRNSTFTKSSYIFSQKKFMYKHYREKRRTGTWRIVSEAIRLSGNCPYDFSAVPLSQKTLLFFSKFFSLKLFKIKFLIGLQLDFRWLFDVCWNQLIKKIIPDFFSSKFCFMNRIWIDANFFKIKSLK